MWIWDRKITFSTCKEKSIWVLFWTSLQPDGHLFSEVEKNFVLYFPSLPGLQIQRQRYLKASLLLLECFSISFEVIEDDSDVNSMQNSNVMIRDISHTLMNPFPAVFTNSNDHAKPNWASQTKRTYFIVTSSTNATSSTSHDFFMKLFSLFLNWSQNDISFL